MFSLVSVPASKSLRLAGVEEEAVMLREPRDFAAPISAGSGQIQTIISSLAFSIG
jgi:hypothetical protein